MTETARAIRIAVVGIGKMGLSHLAIVNAQPDLEVAAVCDASSYLLGVLEKYTGVATYDDYGRCSREVELDAVLIATPSRTHASMVRAALERGLHVFCEKPFTLDSATPTELAALAREQGPRDPGRLPQPLRRRRSRRSSACSTPARSATVTHVLAEAYGPVVLKPKGGTWRSRKAEGGGCLYDYAAHPLNLLTWYFGSRRGVSGTVLGRSSRARPTTRCTARSTSPAGRARSSR